MKGSRNSISLIPISFCFLLLLRDEFAVPARHLCHPEQRDAILKFKNELQILKPCFDRSPKKTVSWVNNSDCCSWDGIRCDSSFGGVIELNLSDNCLYGQLNSKSSILRLQSLPFLTTLDLSNNHFSGSVPSSLGNLSKLTTLDLSNNAFSGEIPFSLGNLLHLTFLKLPENNFVGEIPSSLRNLSNITTLNLSQNNFIGKIPRNLSYLTDLIICTNNLVGEVLSSLENLSHLTFLSLCENKFSGEIPSPFGKFSHLTFLDLSQNSFVGQIPSSFSRLNQLTILSAENNMLTGNFPVTLLNLTKLLSLSLYGNQFTGRLPPNISSLSNLEYFYISSNAFTRTLSSSLFTIPSLTYITLDDNHLNGTLEFGNISLSSKIADLCLGNNNFMGSIPRFISKLVNLDTLDLSHLNTQGSVVDLSIFWNLKSLAQLDISDLNTTMTLDLNVILSCFKSLGTLNLSGNHVTAENRSSVSDPPPLLSELYLSGCGITEFPELIQTQHDMKILDSSNNKIKGRVPEWLWELSVLQYLNLSNNTFISFESPTKLRKPSSLSYFSGANNNLTGRIPSFICELRSLTILDLSNNKFKGSFPRCIGKFSSVLQALNLRQNCLSGRLPNIISRLLKSFDVGHNQLVGKLPRSLVTSFFLEVLNVESNIFNDTFPFWLSSLSELQVLVLRSNAFHGPIHQTLLHKLHVLNLSSNAFTGRIPSSMGNLSSLESLDLSKNKLTREIPQEIGNLSYLAYMNFSHNQLVGLVPGGTQFRTQPCTSFKDNPGLYVPSLDEVCVDIHGKTSQQSEMSKEEEGEDGQEVVISWIAAAIGFIPGIAFGFTMGYVVVSYKPEWFINLFGRTKHRSISTTCR